LDTGRQKLVGITLCHPQAFTYLQQRFQCAIADEDATADRREAGETE
jgi:hypothetical protein